MKELQEADFSTATSTGTVLVDFGAEWCGPCKTLLPVLRKISTEYEGRLSVYSVDIDAQPGLAALNGVMSVPTMLLFKDGTQVDRVVGALSERDLKQKLEPHVAG